MARHSFGTNLMIYDGNIKSISSLLGHTTLKHTEKYVRVVEDLKQRAVNALPQIEL
ncbi:MAG: tyrosine-type recombinase/integrase [Emticicia sp.]|nr:tyrosine-type recombinase/integrase [Emticicia sp.]